MHVIYFPWMHPEGAPHAAGMGVSFLDPGLGGSRQAECLWVPEDLPLDRRQASRYVQEALSFGEQFQDYKDLEYVRAAGLNDFFSGTSSSLSDELERRLREHSGERDNPEEERKRRGQMVLLLHWMWEDKLLEVQSGERKYREVMSELRENLGMEESENSDGYGSRDLSGGLAGQDPSRWSGLMPWFLLFLPADGILYIEDEAIQEELRENGMEPVPWSQLSGYEELGRFVRERGVNCEPSVCEGWRLALKDRPDPEMPWLNREYALLLRKG
ncbi:MAG: hypothetical protein K9J48_04305 [Desulfohalobiaceae bacterium]|nr:hypothetical protein [Desulfohalobiaceae bacterium]